MSDAGDEERLRGNERRDCERRSREPRGGPGREVDARDRGRNEGRTSSAGFIVRDRTSRVRTCWRVCPGRREREQPPCCLSTWRSHFWGTRFEKFNGGFRPISRVCEPSSRWPIRFRQGSAITPPHAVWPRRNPRLHRWRPRRRRARCWSEGPGVGSVDPPPDFPPRHPRPREHDIGRFRAPGRVSRFITSASGGCGLWG